MSSAELTGINFDVTGTADTSAIEKVTNLLSGLRNSLHGVQKSVDGTKNKFSTMLKTISSKIPEPIKNLVGLKNPLTALKDEADGVRKKFDNLLGSLKRIAFYRLIRTAIKAIAQGFKEGMQNAYQFSRAGGDMGVFAASMDRIATSTLYLKNSLGAMVMPIMNMIAPALDYIIDKFVAVLNVVNQLFALFSGAGSWTQALKYPKAYADAAGTATGKVKELQKTILGFDEINKLNKQNEPSGGGGASGLNYGKMFKQSPFDTLLKKFFDEKDWKGLGTYLGNKINEAIASVPWAELGKKFGEKLDMIFQVAYWTLKTIDFTALGGYIATFLSNAINNVEWEYFGRLMVRKVTAMFDFAIGFLLGMDWGGVAHALSSGIMGYLFEWGEWLGSIDWVAFGNGLWNSFVDFVTNFDWAGVIQAAFYAIGSVLGALVGFLGGIITGFMDTVINDVVTPTLESLSRKLGEDGISGFLEGILDIAVGIGTWIKEHVIDPFVEGFKSALGIHSPSTVMREIGTQTLQGFFNGVSQKFNEMHTWLQNKISAIKNVFNFTWSFPKIQLPYIPTPHLSWDTYDVFGSSFSIPRISFYAKGGFPNKGDLFMANEAGAEMVGSMGNRTAVANNQQIVEGIRQGVRDANADELRLMREQNDLLRDILAKEGTATVTLSSVTTALQRKNQRDGGTYVPVG